MKTPGTTLNPHQHGTAVEPSPARLRSPAGGDSLFDAHAVKQAINTLIEPGSVFEIRAVDATIGNKYRTGIVSGFSDNADSVVAALPSITKAMSIYVTLNPVNPDLLARRCNRLDYAEKGATTGDANIVKRRWLLIDVDPTRLALISSTDAEKAYAKKLAQAIRDHLTGLGWPAPVVGDSGNGWHLLYRIEVATADDGLVAGVLTALAAKFDNGHCKVDQTTFNPARITKLYGTLACKGDSVPTRPHRMSRLIQVPELLEIVSNDQLKALAAMAPPTVSPPKAQTPVTTKARASRKGDFDLREFFARHNIEVKRETVKSDCIMFEVPCPFDSTHGDHGEAAVFQQNDGKLGFKCHHNGCAGNHWKEYRLAYEPAAERRKSNSNGNKQSPLPVEAYYDSQRGCYWIRNSRGGWVSLTETALRRYLKANGFSAAVGDQLLISPLDEALLFIQQTRDVDYAGPLAGFKIGVHDVQGRRILVTESPALIEPAPGPWPLLGKLIENLLLDDLCDQRPYLYGWLKVAIESLRQWQRRPGQGLAIAGPHDCGKSLLQNLITVLLGGRMAKPYQYMTGLTAFNADCFAAEHQMIEDEAASTDFRARRTFGANLKNVTVNDVQRCHAKNRTPISLPPFWRLTITVNDEPENLMVLPPIDDSIEDKLILLRARKRPMPARTSTLAERTAFWSALLAELPAFVDYLIKWEIPVELRSERFGITHYHHPEILRAIDDLAPEKRLLTLIDSEVFKDGAPRQWHGTAEELETLLTDREAGTSYAARQLFTFNTACGVYLGRLARKHPDRVAEKRVSTGRRWTINHPESVTGCEGISIFSNVSKKTIRETGESSTNPGTASHPVTVPEPQEADANGTFRL